MDAYILGCLTNYVIPQRSVHLIIQYMFGLQDASVVIFVLCDSFPTHVGVKRKQHITPNMLSFNEARIKKNSSIIQFILRLV